MKPSLPSSHRKRLLLIGLILLLALIFRLYFLLAHSSYMDGDEAINGLMAKHILSQGDWPIFLPGQAYNGVPYQYLVAPIFALFGVSNFTFKIVPLAISLLFVYLVYLLGKKVADNKSGIVAMLIAAFCPPFINMWNVSARSEYVVTLTLGTLILILGNEIAFTKRRKPEALYFFLGLVSGVAFWTSQLVASYILAVFIIIFLKDKRFLLRRTILFFLLGFIVGNMPMILFNLKHNWASYAFLLERGGGQPLSLLKAFPTRFWEIITVSFPIMLGGSLWELETTTFRRLISMVLMAFFFLSFLFVFYQRIRDSLVGKKGLGKMDLLLIHFLIVIILFSLTGFGWLTKEPRYLLPLFTTIPIFQAIFLLGLKNKSKWIFSGSLIPLILLNVYGNINFSPTVDPDHALWPQDRQLTDYLVKSNISIPIANYWIAYRITFESNEKVIAIPYHLRRFDDIYHDQVDISQAGRYLIFLKKRFDDPLFKYFSSDFVGPLDSAQEYAHNLRSNKVNFTTREFTHYVLFDLGAKPEIAWPP